MQGYYPSTNQNNAAPGYNDNGFTAAYGNQMPPQANLNMNNYNPNMNPNPNMGYNPNPNMNYNYNPNPNLVNNQVINVQPPIKGNMNCAYCRGSGFIYKGKKTKRCKHCDIANPYRGKTWCCCLKINSKGYKKCKIDKHVCEIL